MAGATVPGVKKRAHGGSADQATTCSVDLLPAVRSGTPLKKRPADVSRMPAPPSSRSGTSVRSRAVLFLVLTVLALQVVPASVAAQESRAGGSVVVEAGETTGDLEAFGGQVEIRGTVDGDLSAFAGNVVIAGNVTGDVETAAGNVMIAGQVDGNVSAGGGNVQLAESGSVGGTFEAGAASVRIDGTVDGNARVGADTITVGETASIGGDLEYDGTLDVADGAQIQGETIQTDDLQTGAEPAPVVPGWIFGVYALLVTLLVGAVLLLAFPAFSRGLVDRTADRPGWTGLAGIGALVGIPIVLVVVAITIVGIPLALAGFFLWLLALWIGSIYGRYVLGAWLLSLADRENRWAALVLGVVLVAVLGWLPIVGGLIELVVLLLGLGALAMGLYDAYRRSRGSSDESDGAATTGRGETA